MSIQTKPIFVATAAGAVAGALVVVTIPYLFIGGGADHSTEWAPVASSNNPGSVDESEGSLTTPVQVLTGDDRARVARVEQRLDAVAKSLSRSQREIEAYQLDDPRETDEEATADAFDLEQARLYEMESWEQKNGSFQAERVDETWAYEARDAFVTDMFSVAQENGLTVMDADCRTTQCQVVVEWPTYDDAVAGFNELLHHEYQINCAKETLLPEPAESDASLPYQMTVLFDCSGA